MRKPGGGLSPLRLFCEGEGIAPETVLRNWRRNGRAPQLLDINGRYYISQAEWDAWRLRRKADRIAADKPWLRAPLPTTPRARKGNGEGV
jgi:hypothetical protein